MYREVFVEPAISAAQIVRTVGGHTLSLLLHNPFSSAAIAKHHQQAAEAAAAKRSLETHSVIGELVIKSWSGTAPSLLKMSPMSLWILVVNAREYSLKLFLTRIKHYYCVILLLNNAYPRTIKRRRQLVAPQT